MNKFTKNKRQRVVSGHKKDQTKTDTTAIETGVSTKNFKEKIIMKEVIIRDEDVKPKTKVKANKGKRVILIEHQNINNKQDKKNNNKK